MSTDRRIKDLERAAARGEPGAQARLERERTRAADRDEQGPGGFTLLPAAPGTCPECAQAHAPEQAHNAQSLFYQYRFRSQHGRWPTWKDAVAHLPPAIAARWEQALRARGAWTEPTSTEPEELPTGLIGERIVLPMEPEKPARRRRRRSS